MEIEIPPSGLDSVQGEFGHWAEHCNVGHQGDELSWDKVSFSGSTLQEMERGAMKCPPAWASYDSEWQQERDLHFVFPRGADTRASDPKQRKTSAQIRQKYIIYIRCTTVTETAKFMCPWCTQVCGWRIPG